MDFIFHLLLFLLCKRRNIMAVFSEEFVFRLFVFFFVCFCFFFLRPPKFVIADLEIGGGGILSFYRSLQRKRFLSPSHVPSLDFCAVMKNFSLLIACLVTFLRVIDLRFCCFEFGVNLAPVIVLIE